MHFRLELMVSGIFLQGGPAGLLEISLLNPRPTTIRVSRCEPFGIPAADGRSVATAHCEIDPNPRVVAAFSELAAGRLPAGIDDQFASHWKRYQNDDGTLQHGAIIPTVGLPEYFVSFVEQVKRDLFNAIRRTCGVLRWRHALDGPHSPFQDRGPGAEWSVDGISWTPLPTGTGLRLHAVPSVYPTEDVQVDLQSLLRTGADEPVAHHLLREAWDNCYTNRRSALIVGVAALEVGVKTLLASCVPDAEWLVTNLPTPPVKRILTEYLPKLDTARQIGGVVRIPDATLTLLDKAISLRNKVAHATGEDVDVERLDGMLGGIQDALWLFDYYSGSEWALDHLSEQCRTELGLHVD